MRRLIQSQLILLAVIVGMLGAGIYFVLTGDEEGESDRGALGSEFFTPEGVEGVVNLLAPTTVCPISSATQMLCLHNYARGQHNLPPFKAQPLLYKSAGLQADRIIQCQAFTHYPCGESPWSKMAAVGYTRGRGENIAYGQPTIRGTFQAWLNSPGHLANILSTASSEYGSATRPGPFSLRSGTGQLFGGTKLWVVQMGAG